MKKKPPSRALSESRPGSADAPDALITDLPYIRRYAEQNDDRNTDFRTYLKCHYGYEELDALVRQTTDDVLPQIDCTSCANCCRVMNVPVTDEDVARLATRLNLPPEAFCERYTRIIEDAPDHRQRILLSMPCVFLGDDNRCTVYEDRPETCREFPFLHKAAFVSRLWGVIENAAVCPIVFNVWQRLQRQLWKRRRAPF